MKKKADWKNHFIELIVVFIGITAAFMLNNWRESAKDRQLEQKYLSSFLSNIRSDSGHLQQIIPANKIKLRNAEWFVHSVKQKKNPSAD